MIVTIAYHSSHALELLSRDLSCQNEHPTRWVIVNNSPNSSEPIQLHTPFPTLVIAGEEGSGFAEGCNLALDYLLNDLWDGWVWLLNPDITLQKSTILNSLRISLASCPENVLVGTAVFDCIGNLEKSAGWIDPGLDFRRRRINHESLITYKNQLLPLDWVSGCSMLLSPGCLLEKPRFEESLPLYYEDMDFCIRLARKNSKVLWMPSISVGHQNGQGSLTSPNRRLRLSSCSYIRFLQRHRPGIVLILRTFRILILALVRLPVTPARSISVFHGCFQAFLNPLD